jgi:hypothetical protein
LLKELSFSEFPWFFIDRWSQFYSLDFLHLAEF